MEKQRNCFSKISQFPLISVKASEISTIDKNDKNTQSSIKTKISTMKINSKPNGSHLKKFSMSISENLKTLRPIINLNQNFLVKGSSTISKNNEKETSIFDKVY